MNMTNRNRVERILDALRDALGPYVLGRYRATYGTNYGKEIAQKLSSQSFSLSPTVYSSESALLATLDVHDLLLLIWRGWDVFGATLERVGRSYVSELIDARNDWAHQASFSDDDAYRVADTAARLLRMVNAPEQLQVAEQIADELLRGRFVGESERAKESAARKLREAQDARETAVRELREIQLAKDNVDRKLRETAKRVQDVARELQAVGQRLLDTATPGRPLRTTPEPTPPRRKEDDGTAELDERRGKAIRSIAKAARTGSKRRLSAGLKTPPSTYRIPILRALTEAGGAARTAWALDRVYEMMQHRLNDYDLQMNPSGGDLRWHNTAQWERLRMVKEGLLANDSPYGVWEITEAGRRYLAEHAGKEDIGTAELDERRGKTVRTIGKDLQVTRGSAPPRGVKTPVRAYRIPILRALTEAGGAGSTAAILDLVYELMQHRLNDYDLQMKPSGGLRWRNTAQWERLQMVKEGLLANDSPHGIWKITAAGRRYLDEHGDEG